MKVVEKKNKEGRVEELAFTDDKGELILNDSGIAKKVFAFDAGGNVIEECYCGLAGEPVVHGMYGCAKIERSFDASHRAIEERYYGVSGEPVKQKVHGFAKITWVYCGSRTIKLYHRRLLSKGVAIDSSKLEKLFRVCRLPALGQEEEV